VKYKVGMPIGLRYVGTLTGYNLGWSFTVIGHRDVNADFIEWGISPGVKDVMNSPLNDIWTLDPISKKKLDFEKQMKEII